MKMILGFHISPTESGACTVEVMYVNDTSELYVFKDEPSARKFILDWHMSQEDDHKQNKSKSPSSTT